MSDTIFIADQQFNLQKGLLPYTASPIIEISNLQIAYKDKEYPAIDNINFNISRGDFVALMGPSGCGKSTLLKELGGANNRTRGEIKISGRPIGEYFHTELKTKIGFVSQDDHLHPDLTVYETLFYTAKLRNTFSYEVRIKDLLTKLGIEERKSQKIATLSGGQRKRVAIAVELLDAPDILLMDEPTSPLDPESIDAFLTTMNKLAKDLNKAIIMVTHKPDDMKYVDYVIFLDCHGIVRYAGLKEKFIDQTLAAIRAERPNFVAQDQLLGIYSYYSKNSRQAKSRISTISSNRAKPHTYRQTYGFMKQLFWLFMRYVRIKFSAISKKKDKHGAEWPDFTKGSIRSIGNYLLQPFILGLLFKVFPNFSITCLFLISLAVLWLSVNNASKEIVDELPIFQRERAYNLKIDTYLISKILLLTIISIFQIIIILLMVRWQFNGHKDSRYPGTILFDPVKTGLFLVMLSLAGTMLGLLASTIGKRTEFVLMLVPLLLMPQIILSGLLVNQIPRAKKHSAIL